MTHTHSSATLVRRPVAVFAEVAKRRYEHTSFNEGVLCSATERGNDVIMLADPSHIACLSPKLKCHYVEIPVLSLGSRMRSVWKYLREFRTTQHCIRYARNQGSRITFLSVSPSTLFFLGLLARLGNEFSVFVHNELELLTVSQASSNHRIRRRLVSCALTLLEGSPSRVLCLTHTGTDLLRRRFPRLAVAYYEHPMNPSAQRLMRNPPQHRTGGQVFALVGTLREAAINMQIRALCNALDSLPVNKKIRLDIIGGGGLEQATRHLLKTCPSIDCRFVVAPKQDDYLRALAACNVLLFLSSPSLYTVSASGVLVDAVSLGIEVYALRCGYAEELAVSHAVRIFDSIAQVSEAVHGRSHNSFPQGDPSALQASAPTAAR